MNPDFLSVDDVLQIHADQIARYGGSEGVRDLGLLESAAAQPMAQFGDQFLHRDLFEMAAALHFSLTNNHAFVNGNKRTALAAAVLFLKINGHFIDQPSTQALVDVTLAVAAGSATKNDVAAVFRDLASRTSKAGGSRWRRWIDSFLRFLRLAC